MLVVFGMALFTWFLIDWIVSLKKSVWILIAAITLVFLLAFASLMTLAIYTGGPGTIPGSAFFWVLIAGIWSAVRSYRRPQPIDPQSDGGLTYMKTKRSERDVNK